MHEMHEESEKGKIKNPYQVKDDWIRLKMKREEGFWEKKGFRSREKRERLRCLKWFKTRSDLRSIY